MVRVDPRTSHRPVQGSDQGSTAARRDSEANRPRNVVDPAQQEPEIRSSRATEWLSPRHIARSAPGGPSNGPMAQRRGTKPTHNSACRSEEHTSELQSRQYLVCRLLLEK